MIKSSIGIHAGTIWNLLSNQQEYSITELAKITERGDSETLLALGWLSRENKIRIFDKEGTLYVQLDEFVGESFF